MLIGEVARRSDLSVKTLRYYEEIGVLSPPERSSSGYRRYGPEVIDRLHFVRQSQALGFTLGEIREVLAYRDQGTTPCSHVMEMLQSHKRQVAQRIADLQALEDDLASLLERAGSLMPEDCSPTEVCHLIARPKSPAAERIGS